MTAAPPPPAQPQPAAAEELRITVGEGVDMELVGRLQFRGSIVRVQPLPQGADTQSRPSHRSSQLFSQLVGLPAVLRW